MHSFSGDHLLVFDPFGLTRVTLPGRVKHNKKVNGEFLVQNGPLLVGHSNVSNRRFAMTVPELKILAVENWNYNLAYGEAMAVTPAGLPFEVLDNELVIYGMDGKQRSRVKQPKGKLLPRIDFGPQLSAASTHWSASVAMGPDGSFVVFADGRLVGGKLGRQVGGDHRGGRARGGDRRSVEVRAARSVRSSRHSMRRRARRSGADLRWQRWCAYLSVHRSGRLRRHEHRHQRHDRGLPR
jgi:hypothetical protein